MRNLLYIGLNGYAGSGKDTVAKMLYCILNYNWETKEECWNKFKKEYATSVKPYATMGSNSQDHLCTCVAFADRLKDICAAMFGVPVDYFYYNKNNAWICINKDFEYTETRPRDEFIITSKDFYTCKDSYKYSSNRYYMSLREILVYVGTYICQDYINENTFVNSVKNRLESISWDSTDLKYVICTDVRFVHEVDFIKQNSGIMINIIRDDVVQALDIAEHDLDMMDPENFNYIIYNNGTYEELFDEVWRMCQSNMEFNNYTVPLRGRTHDANTYIRFVNEYEDHFECRLCAPNGIAKVTHSDGDITTIDPEGGPQISINVPLLVNGINYIVSSIDFNEERSEYYITLKK